MVVSIRNTASVRCSAGVRFSEGPLWEVPLYMSSSKYSLEQKISSLQKHKPSEFCNTLALNEKFARLDRASYTFLLGFQFHHMLVHIV